MKVVILNSADIAQVVAGDSLPPVKVQVQEDNGSVADITGKILYFVLNDKNPNGTVGTNRIRKAMTITNAVAGLAQYDWEYTQLVNDLDLAAGAYYFDIVLENADTPAVTGAPVTVVQNGDETKASSGVFTGDQDTVYTIHVTTGGAFASSVVTITSVGAEAVNTALTPVSGTPFNVGTKGVIFTLTDGGNLNLSAGDKWTISCVAMVPGSRYTLTKNYETIKLRQKLA